MKASNVVLGVIGGIAAGTIIGVLFAPDKGSNTRKKMADKQKDLKKFLKKNTDKFAKKSATELHDLKAGTEEALEYNK